jgi:hypothetical protein
MSRNLPYDRRDAARADRERHGRQIREMLARRKRERQGREYSRSPPRFNVLRRGEPERARWQSPERRRSPPQRSTSGGAPRWSSEGGRPVGHMRGGRPTGPMLGGRPTGPIGGGPERSGARPRGYAADVPDPLSAAAAGERGRAKGRGEELSGREE